MSILLDALKNAENAKNGSESTDNKSGTDDDFVVSAVDSAIDADPQLEQPVNLEQAVNPLSSFASESKNAEIESVDSDATADIEAESSSITESDFVGIDRRFTATNNDSPEEQDPLVEHQTKNALAEPTSSPGDYQAETKTETASADTLPAAKDDSQTNAQETTSLDWELPPDTHQPKHASLNAKASELSLDHDENKPQYFHYAQPKAKSNSRSILLILFILMGTLGGTILLYFLNQASVKKPLFSNSTTPGLAKTVGTQRAIVTAKANSQKNTHTIKSSSEADKKVLPANTNTDTQANTSVKTSPVSVGDSDSSSGTTKHKAASIVTKPKVQMSSLDLPKTGTSESSLSTPGNKSVTKIQNNLGNEEVRKTIRIVKHRSSSKVNPNLSKAYQYYQQGQMPKAQSLYRQILDSNDKSRDAMLGLAAIAIHYRQTSRAASYYKALLILNPQDHAAITGLLSLNKDSDRAHSISTVKQLIKQRNASASLFFLLGNLHAANRSWPDAQEAYFEAWNRNNTNPDYAYNLAISLDSLNKRASALTYYRAALKLANKNAARFDRHELRRRIRELSRHQSRRSL